MFISRTPPVQPCLHLGGGDVCFTQPEAMLLLELFSSWGHRSSYCQDELGKKYIEGADSSKTASDGLRHPDSIPRLSITVSTWASFNQELVSADYEPGTVLGLQT